MPKDGKKAKASDAGPIGRLSASARKKVFSANQTPNVKSDAPSRRLREIAELQEAVKSGKLRRVRTKKKADFVTQEASKLGFSRRPWETTDSFASRVIKETGQEAAEQRELAKFGIGARSKRELDEEFRQLNADTRKQKAVEIMRAERKAKKRSKAKGDDDESEFDSDEDSDERGAPSKPGKKAKKLNSKQTRKSRVQAFQQKQRENDDLDFFLSAKEKIPFGERVDAPPTFSGALRKEMEPLNASAGSKNLLLKQLFVKPAVDEPGPSDGGSKTVTADERQRVIDMYRSIKRKPGRRDAS